MSGPIEPPSWEEHAAAAAALGLDPREAYETYDGFPGVVKACRERREAVTAMLDALDERRE